MVATTQIIRTMQGLLNVGYTLVYHQAVDDEYWVGRTVTLLFKPGVCTSARMEHPSIEWTTMGGGKVTAVETKAISLLGVDAISVSNVQSGMMPLSEFVIREGGGASLADLDKWCSINPCVDEELDCFFTITSADGEVHLFESLNADESSRIVAGIKNVAARFCSQLIAGDSNTVADFFDNTQEPEETQLSMDETMLRISNFFLDSLF